MGHLTNVKWRRTSLKCLRMPIFSTFLELIEGSSLINCFCRTAPVGLLLETRRFYLPPPIVFTSHLHYQSDRSLVRVRLLQDKWFKWDLCIIYLNIQHQNTYQLGCNYFKFSSVTPVPNKGTYSGRLRPWQTLSPYTYVALANYSPIPLGAMLA